MARVTLALACAALLACGDDDGGAQGMDGGGIDGGSGNDAGEAGSGGSSGGGEGGNGGIDGGESGSGGGGSGGATIPPDGGGTMDAATADAATDAATDAGGASDCPNGTIEVEIDGTPHGGCVDMFHTGGLNHVIGTLDDGSGIVVNFSGMMADTDVCVSVSLRKPGNASNDWDSMTNGCETTITEYDTAMGHAVGTFAATVEPSVTNDEPARELTNGAFDAISKMP